MANISYKDRNYDNSVIRTDIEQNLGDDQKVAAVKNLGLSDVARKSDVEAVKGTLLTNNLVSEEKNATNTGIIVSTGTYGAKGAKYEIPANVFNNTNGACHISFDFRLDEDVNIGDAVDKDFFSIIKGNYITKFLLHTERTEVFSGKESKGAHTLSSTTSGMPKFKSKFGTSSNYPGGDAPNYLNMFMSPRTLNYDDNNNSSNFKPLCGSDLFSIEVRAVDSNNNEIEDTRSGAAQAIYGIWQQSYIEVTEEAVVIVTPSTTHSYTLANYNTISELFADIFELNGTIDSGAKIIIKDISTYYHTHLQSTINGICKCKMYIGSEHPNSDGTTSFYDSFPCYVPYGLDYSWHTFELLAQKGIDKMSFCIDGQYYGSAAARNFTISNCRYIIKGAKLVFGGDLNVTFRNLLIESNDYKYAEAGYGVHYIISQKNPYILNLFMHEMYYTPYLGGNFSDYTKFVSEGGHIPDELKNSNDAYRGDDYIQNSRKNLAFPSWSIDEILARLESSHYMCISKKDLSKVLSGEIVSPYNRFYILDIDDHQTYIYDRKDCRSIFENHHSKPCMALELGFYVSSDIPSSESGYDCSEFIERVKDTSSHRNQLQKRIASMLASSWSMDIHGSVEGYVFQGKTCNEIRTEIRSAMNICKYYGWPITAWCYAANYYTPNACKMIGEAGIEYGTSTESQPVSKCRDNIIIPRVMITTNTDNNVKVII